MNLMHNGLIENLENLPVKLTEMYWGHRGDITFVMSPLFAQFFIEERT